MVRGLGDMLSLVVGGKVPGPGQSEGRMGYRLSFLFTQVRTRRFRPKVKAPGKTAPDSWANTRQHVEALLAVGNQQDCGLGPGL